MTCILRAKGLKGGNMKGFRNPVSEKAPVNAYNKVFNSTFDIFFPDHKTDSREEDKQEARQKENKRRDDE